MVLLLISLGVNVFFLVEDSITGNVVIEEEEKEEIGLDVYTEAVCDEGNESISCHDEVFVQCGEMETKLGNIIGNTVEFELDWEDPRS